MTVATDTRPADLSKPAPRTLDRNFRPDVEGLRAVAVLMVVAQHAGFTLLPGGYVGVDVFFVLSGFLITGLLLKEHDASGMISVAICFKTRETAYKSRRIFSFRGIDSGTLRCYVYAEIHRVSDWMARLIRIVSMGVLPLGRIYRSLGYYMLGGVMETVRVGQEHAGNRFGVTIGSS